MVRWADRQYQTLAVSWTIDGALQWALLCLTLVSMRILYAVFVLSLVALVWTILALTRHIREHDTQTSDPLHLTGSNDDPLKDLE
jgi:hypothetical protein